MKRTYLLLATLTFLTFSCSTDNDSAGDASQEDPIAVKEPVEEEPIAEEAPVESIPVDAEDVPLPVLKCMRANYSGAENVRWELEGGLYEAEFNLGDAEMEALIDSEGSLLEVETKLPVEVLPPSILNKIAEFYADYDIKEVSELQRKRTVFFKVDVQNSEVEVELVMTMEGEIVEENIERLDEEAEGEDGK